MKSLKSITQKVCIAVMVLSITLLTGCGRDALLDKYKTNMEGYFDQVAAINYHMNCVDVSGAETAEELEVAYSLILQNLDELDTLTAQMADYEVPEQFELCEGLADEAAENMSQAVSLFHELYESDEYNESLADGAYEYYERANMRIGYIRSILQGNIPEDLTIEYEEE